MMSSGVYLVDQTGRFRIRGSGGGLPDVAGELHHGGAHAVMGSSDRLPGNSPLPFRCFGCRDTVKVDGQLLEPEDNLPANGAAAAAEHWLMQCTGTIRAWADGGPADIAPSTASNSTSPASDRRHRSHSRTGRPIRRRPAGDRQAHRIGTHRRRTRSPSEPSRASACSHLNCSEY